MPAPAGGVAGGVQDGSGGGGRGHYAEGVRLGRSILLCLLALSSGAGVVASEGGVAGGGTQREVSEPVHPELPFRIVREPGGIAIFALGVNRFTPRQLARFLTGLDAFLARAASEPPGTQLVWRVDGLGGYLSLSTSPFSGGADYLLTLRAEPVRTFEDRRALLQVMDRLGRAVLNETRLPVEDAPPGRDVPRLTP